MSLISCSDCHHPISEHADICVYCGCPVRLTLQINQNQKSGSTPTITADIIENATCSSDIHGLIKGKLLLDAKDLKSLGFSTTVAYQMLNQAVMPTIRIGRRVYMHQGKFLEWLAERAGSGNGSIT